MLIDLEKIGTTRYLYRGAVIPSSVAGPRGGHHGSLTGSCEEPGTLKGARRVREAARENGTATTTVTASRADFHRPASTLITRFIAEHQGNARVGHLGRYLWHGPFVAQRVSRADI